MREEGTGERSPINRRPPSPSLDRRRVLITNLMANTSTVLPPATSHQHHGINRIRWRSNWRWSTITVTCTNHWISSSATCLQVHSFVHRCPTPPALDLTWTSVYRTDSRSRLSHWMGDERDGKSQIEIHRQRTSHEATERSSCTWVSCLTGAAPPLLLVHC